MPAPVVLVHVAERGRDAALRRYRMRAGRKDLGDAGGAQAGLAATDHRAKARAAGADHHDVIGVVLDRIGVSVGGKGSRAGCSVPLAMSPYGHGLSST